MDNAQVVATLQLILPKELATALVDDFLLLRQDVATGTLGRSAPGKLVESMVQALQYLDTGKYDEKPAVDDYLKRLESQSTKLNDGLRICASRIARSMYTLRNKRNILHKGDVDPNRYDLQFLLAGAQWLLAELVRTASAGTMADAGRIVEQIQAPVGGLVEDFGGRRLVLRDVSAREEILVLLHSHYPDRVPVSEIRRSMDRRAARTVTNTLRILWSERLVEGGAKEGYALTKRGFAAAMALVKDLVD